MLGPLPPLYRWIVCILALVACVGAGAWLAVRLPVPLIATSGAGIGAALGAVLGAVLVMLVLHDGDGPARARRTR